VLAQQEPLSSVTAEVHGSDLLLRQVREKRLDLELGFEWSRMAEIGIVELVGPRLVHLTGRLDALPADTAANLNCSYKDDPRMMRYPELQLTSNR
jgi:hypothetical protein